MATISFDSAKHAPPPSSRDNNLLLAGAALLLLIAVDIGGFAQVLAPRQAQVTATATANSAAGKASKATAAPVSSVAIENPAPVVSANATLAELVNLPRTSSSFAPVSLMCDGDVTLRQAENHMAEMAPHRGLVEVRLSDGDAEIHLPNGFNPNAQDGGWYKLKNFEATSDDVNGNAVISFLDKPFFRIDRISGRIDVSGLGGTFSGECRNTEA